MPNDMTPKRGYAFKDHSRTRPTVPLPGDRLDTELDRAFSALEAQHKRLTKSFNPDGTLKAQFIGSTSLRPQTIETWAENVRQSLLPDIEKVERAEKNTQTWLTQTRNIAQDVAQIVAQTQQTASQAVSAAQELDTLKNDTLQSRSRAERAAQTSQVRAQNTETAAASARISEDMAYRWAEKLDGPVFVPSGGDPVDDGFYSAKFWANQAKIIADDFDANYDQVEAWYVEIRDVFYPETLAAYTDFRSTYYSPSATDPTQDPLGNPPTTGDLYFNTAQNKMLVYDGATWVPFEGQSQFLTLIDTPANYSNAAGRVVAVNPTETGLEFQDPQDFLDDVYVKTTGDTITGRLILNTADVTNALSLRRSNGSNTVRISMDRGDGSVSSRFAGSNAGPIIEAADTNSTVVNLLSVTQDDVFLSGASTDTTTLAQDDSLVTRAKGDARYVRPTDTLPYLPLGGGTVTGRLTLSENSSASLRLQRQDGTTGMGIDYRRGDGSIFARLRTTGSQFLLAKYAPSGNIIVNELGLSETDVFVLGASATDPTVPSDGSLLTRLKGDARYIQQSTPLDFVSTTGDTMTGPLNIDATSSAACLVLSRPGNLEVTRIDFLRGNKSTNAQLRSAPNELSVQACDATGTVVNELVTSTSDLRAKGVSATDASLSDDASLVTRLKGDARYVNNDGDSMTGRLNINLTSATALRFQRTDSSLSMNLEFRRSDSTTLGRVQTGSSQIELSKFSTSGTETSSILVRDDDVRLSGLAADTTLSQPESVVTRDKGDTRYALKSEIPDPAPTIQSFHDPTGVASWRIVGDTLECWGLGDVGATGVLDVPFPKTFARPPAVTVGATNRVPGGFMAGVGTDGEGNEEGAPTTTGFKLLAVASGSAQPTARSHYWHAIGEWDGVS